ncbi:predicted protein [Histoplasma mississippiense (nom. inval.)]|uniref:predicted protein n=1 Tax=Ajellomyces capsulatus (strain NAm1 / WU24) TaxID=2059318 RepID=UPI000157CAA0|nr:predicted protein [Histoplasma mississippiense (nom. inval.)]EDN09109.1 predicted protein [Histoplasma mississippiense (nom. inval.)]
MTYTTFQAQRTTIDLILVATHPPHSFGVLLVDLTAPIFLLALTQGLYNEKAQGYTSRSQVPSRSQVKPPCDAWKS